MLSVCTPDCSESEPWQMARKRVARICVQGKTTNLSFSTILGKAKGRLSTLSLVYCRIKRSHTSLRILPQVRARSMEQVWGSLRNPNRADRRYFISKVRKDWRRRLLLQTQGQQCKTSRNMKNQGSKMWPKNHKNQETNFKYMEVCLLPDKEFKIRCLENSATRKHRKKIQQNQENKTKKMRTLTKS